MKIINGTENILLLMTGSLFLVGPYPLSTKFQNVSNISDHFFSYDERLRTTLFSTAEPTHAILLSHIPFSRSETADCGPLRERGNIRRGAGLGYQAMLGKQTTNFLLQKLQPLAIFR
jgi:hypothetical protein